jgi:hypothetical protein
VLRECLGGSRLAQPWLPLCLLALATRSSFPADTPVVPFTVCEVLRDLSSEDGKNVAVLGRYSFREAGSWIGEQSCNPPVDGPSQLSLVESTKDGPKPPGNFELDGVSMRRKLADVERRTSLAKFRFGSPEYDRWAVIYGLVKARQGDEHKKAAASLIYRGSGVIVFLTPE